ncbi:MAG TPA: HEPN domain-containing protein [Candidatus Bipolaricaulis sp.]|nr:HEPN domain-containing protein [Candidatus Bipolaricaulis sp.]HRS17826.1 HEPN domain-containing protein [Thermoanaerobaculaceae bacterium]HRU10816.1 HEPN domain-containing protein [Thermoanaerobaculia bacterium]
MKRAEAVRQEFVQNWLRKAAADLAAAQHLLTGGEHLVSSAAFHAQQTAEKALKAVLIWHQREAPRTHDLALLVDLISSEDPELAHKVRGAVSLTPYGVEARYPGELPEPSAGEVREAVNLAAEILRAVVSRLPREVWPPVEER